MERSIVSRSGAMWKALTAALVAVFLLGAPGCAQMMNGKTQDVLVTASPPGASVSADSLPGQQFGTPAHLELPRKHRNQVVQVQAPGYRPAQVPLTRDMDVLPVALDCLFWWCVPLIWEIPNGSAYVLTPESVSVNLVKEGQSSVEPVPGPSLARSRD